MQAYDIPELVCSLCFATLYRRLESNHPEDQMARYVYEHAESACNCPNVGQKSVLRVYAKFMNPLLEQTVLHGQLSDYVELPKKEKA